MTNEPTEMEEKVARCICAVYRYPGFDPASDVVSDSWEVFLDSARVAIRAMREQTDDGDTSLHDAQSLARALISAQARIAALEKALEPFANLSRAINPYAPNEPRHDQEIRAMLGGIAITVGDLRLAFTTLKGV